MLDDHAARGNFSSERRQPPNGGDSFSALVRNFGRQRLRDRLFDFGGCCGMRFRLPQPTIVKAYQSLIRWAVRLPWLWRKPSLALPSGNCVWLVLCCNVIWEEARATMECRGKRQRQQPCPAASRTADDRLLYSALPAFSNCHPISKNFGLQSSTQQPTLLGGGCLRASC